MLKPLFLVRFATLGLIVAGPVLGPAFALAQHKLADSHPGALMTGDHQLRTSQLVGKSIFNDKGENIGTISDVLVDMKGGPTTVVLSVGKYLGGGAKLVAVPVDHVRLDGNHPMMAGADRQMLLALPAYTFDPMIAHGPAG